MNKKNLCVVKSDLFLTLLLIFAIGCSVLAVRTAHAYDVTMRDFLIMKNGAEHFHDPFDSGGPPPDSPGLTPNPAIILGYGLLGTSTIAEDHTGGGSINMNSGFQYNPNNYGCDAAGCHFNDPEHRLSDSGLPVILKPYLGGN